MINLGTDVISDWSFQDGDLQIVEGTGNLSQALTNRLNTYLGDLSAFYGNYGSILFDYLGEQNKSTIQEYIKIEIEDCVMKDKRVYSADYTVNKISNGEINSSLNLVLIDDTDVDLNMIITKDNTVIINNGVE